MTEQRDREPRREDNENALPRVGDFQPRSQAELDLARRAVEYRRAGDERAYERAVAAIVAQRRGNRETAFTLGAGNGLFGLGDYAAALGTTVTQGGNYIDNLRRQSAIRRAVAERFPASNAAGEVAGVITTLPAAAAATPARLAQAPRLVQAATVGGALGAQQGAANRFAETGDVVEGARGAVEGGAAGAVTGATLDTAARALAPFLRSVGDRLANDNGLRALSRHMNVPIANLQSAARDFSSRFQRNPTLAEVAGIADPALAREAGQIVGSRRASSQVAAEGAEALRTRRQAEVAEAVLPGSSTRANITGEVTDAAMARMSGAALNVGSQGPLFDFLTRPNVARLIRTMPPEQRARFGDAIDNGGRITVRDLDNLRQAANNASNSGAAYAFNEVSETAVRFADRATRGQFSQVIRRDHRANATREEIANAALRSPRGAEQTAEQLARAAGQQRDLAADVGPAEALRLRRVGETADAAARGVDEIAPNRILTSADEQADAIQTAARIAFLNRTGGAGTAAFISQWLKSQNVGPRGAAELARDLTDPARFPDAMRRLERYVGRQGAQSLVGQITRQFAVRGVASATQGGGAEPTSLQDAPPQAQRAATAEPTVADPATQQYLDSRGETVDDAMARSQPVRSEEELINALYAADAAGDTEGAQIIAAAIRARRSQQ